MPRCLIPGFPTSLLAFLVLVAMLSATPPVRAQTGEPALPAEVAALLPAECTVHAAQPADLTGTGEQAWAVLYTTPAADSEFIQDAHLAIVVPGAGGWVVARTVSIELVHVAELRLVALGELPAVVLRAGVGAHASQLAVVRWTGSEFATVFAGGSNSPGIDLEDVDEDGVPEVVNYWSPYCEAYAVSPHLVTVYRWDGAAFVEETGRYPDLLAAVEASVRAALEEAVTWSSGGRGCLHGALAYLAERRGDLDAAAAEYCQAWTLDSAAWDAGSASEAALERVRATCPEVAIPTPLPTFEPEAGPSPG